jgi:phospholipase D3/4
MNVNQVSVLSENENVRVDVAVEDQHLLRGHHKGGRRENKSVGESLAFMKSRTAIGFASAMMMTIVIAVCILVAVYPHSAPVPPTDNCNAEVVESLPFNTNGLSSGAKSTYDAFMTLLESAEESIDLTSLYWTLDSPARVANQTCQDYYSQDCPDCANFNKTQLEEFGVYQGHDVFMALKKAAAKGIDIRIVQSPGLGNGFEEPETLQKLSPKVQVRTMDFSKWYQSGIMHTKIWIIDGKHGYVGSANMDWRSLTQTRETGIFIHSCNSVVNDLRNIYDSFWNLAGVEKDAGKLTRVAFDPVLQINRKVPCWSHLVEGKKRCKSPFKLHQTTPLPVKLNGQKSTVRLSLSPPELCGPNRITDGDMLVETIESASQGGFIYVSVMDFQPVTRYLCRVGSTCPPFEQFHWNALLSPLLDAASNKGADVRLLVSKWAYDTDDAQDILLKYIDYAYEICNPNTTQYRQKCMGSFEIRLIEMPGWYDVLGPNRKYPGHSRVSHSKFMVSDQLVNIGTSNMEWSYFHSTAGVSVNIDNQPMIKQVKHMFELAWDHPNYTHPIYW